MTRAFPDTKKVVPHLFEKGEKVPARYRIGTIKMLHFSFEAEQELSALWSALGKIFFFIYFAPNQMIGVQFFVCIA